MGKQTGQFEARSPRRACVPWTDAQPSTNSDTITRRTRAPARPHPHTPKRENENESDDGARRGRNNREMIMQVI